MPQAPYPFDWNAIAREEYDEPAANPRRRLRWILGFYAAAFALIVLRGVQLELDDGENFRALATQTEETIVVVPPARGRILARDGTVLAADDSVRSLAIHYRYLQSPPDKRWLRRLTRERLTRAERRDPARVAAAERGVRDELRDLERRLAALCNLDEAQWRKRAARIEAQVTAVAELVNGRRLARFHEQTTTDSLDPPLGVAAILAGLFAPPQRLPPAEVIVAEQLAYHRIVEELPAEVCAAIESHPDAFPGTRIVEHTRRNYPHAALAANLLGHVGTSEDAAKQEPETMVGQLGIERACESQLHGRPGQERQWTDRRGRLQSTEVALAPTPGSDVTLALDPALQRFAEQLLDRSAHRGDHHTPRAAEQGTAGGAIVVMDVHSGEILTAASEPRFDPNLFATGDARVAAVLADPRRPLFDRTARMALPPGSVFKPLVALALVEQGVVDPQEPFACQGYLDDPESLRCQIYRRQGIGHGDVTLAAALAQSCNVYFFHHAARLGAEPLVAWAARFGFGRPASSDLPEQSAGHLPAADELRHDAQLQALAIGQGTLTATPLQIVRMYAAIANGGHLIPVRVTRADSPSSPEASRIPDLDPQSLAAVREGLERVVDDPDGTAHHSVRIDDLAIAGKTGTAQSGANQPDHAWFAGYAPADAPRYAFVVVLEHGGSGANAAGTITRSLLERMRALGYFPTSRTTTAQQQFPPGKG